MYMYMYVYIYIYRVNRTITQTSKGVVRKKTSGL